MIDLTRAIAQPNQPFAFYHQLEQLVAATIGIKLFTLMTIDERRGVAKRTYSSMPTAYPVAGEKPIEQNTWTEQIQGRQEIFVANSLAEIAAVFSDYELIQALGCESCLNLPIVINGRTAGTLNCLHTADHYTAARIAAAKTLRPAGATALLLAATFKEDDIND